MARQWFLGGVLIHEDETEREYFVGGVQVVETLEGGGGGITGTFPVIGGQGFVECEGEAGTLPVIGGQGSVIWNGEAGTFPVTGGPGQYVEIE